MCFQALLQWLTPAHHYRTDSLFAIGEHGTSVGPGGSSLGRPSSYKALLQWLTPAHHYRTDSLFAIGCGEPVPERDWTDSVHSCLSPPSSTLCSWCTLPEGSRAAVSSGSGAGVKKGTFWFGVTSLGNSQ